MKTYVNITCSVPSEWSFFQVTKQGPLHPLWTRPSTARATVAFRVTQKTTRPSPVLQGHYQMRKARVTAEVLLCFIDGFTNWLWFLAGRLLAGSANSEEVCSSRSFQQTLAVWDKSTSFAGTMWVEHRMLTILILGLGVGWFIFPRLSPAGDGLGDVLGFLPTRSVSR